MAEGLRSLPAFQQTAPLYVKILPQKAVEKSPFRYPDTDQFHSVIKQHIIYRLSLIFLVMHVLGVQVGISISPLFLGLLTDSDKIQHGIAIRNIEQESDLLIRSTSLPHAVPDMHPASPKPILFYGEQNVGRRYCAVLDPEFGLMLVRRLDHDDDHSIRAVDLGTTHLLAGTDLPDHILVAHNNVFYRLMSKGCRRGQGNLHDLMDHFIVNMGRTIPAYRAPLSRKFI